jgi:DNA-binding NarL/FixJ family response regulator
MALEAGGFVIVGEVGTAHDAVRVTLAERPDACLLDVHIPGGGLAATAMITAHATGALVVMLTSSADANEMIAAIRAGASGYLSKTISERRLPAALRGALSGEATVPRMLVARLLEEVRDSGNRRSVPFFTGDRRIELTAREWQVLELIFAELPTREIAARLGISRVTVRRHVSGLLRKLDARDRKAAVQLLARRRI